MPEIARVTVRELAHKIRSPGNPRFAFFLGAGASRQSGILVASEMIRHFKDQIVAQSGPDGLKTDNEKKGWLEQQDWYKADGSEYSKCFEKFEPKEYGRQRYIEGLMVERRDAAAPAEERKPSFGYFVLANLMAAGHINTVLTTNFDDLVYSACTTFTDLRPTVYAYGVMASEMRVTSPRPKILKLHGDYRYSSLKNTRPELKTQDLNMARQVRQVISEYGLVVVGYGGGDKSVMKILSDISPKNDLYWCAHRGDPPNEAVTKFLRDKGGFLVEIEGFDEMMNEVLRVVGFDMDKMLGSIEDRRNHIVEQFKKFDLKYSSPLIPKVADAIEEPATPAAHGEGTEPRKVKRVLALEALELAAAAYKAYVAKDHPRAEELYRKAIELDPGYTPAYNNLSGILYELKRYGEAEPMARRAIELDPNTAVAHYNLGNILYSSKRYQEAVPAYRKAIELNPGYALAYLGLGITLRELNRSEEAESMIRRAIELDPGFALAYNHLGNILYSSKRYQEAVPAYRKAIELNPGYAYSHFNLSNLLRILGREAEALGFAESALQLDPQSVNALLSLASLHRKLGHKEVSEMFAERARELITPDDWYNLACLESISGNPEAAIENLGRAAQNPTFNNDWARRDPDFEWIRDDPRFEEIVGREAG